MPCGPGGAGEAQVFIPVADAAQAASPAACSNPSLGKASMAGMGKLLRDRLRSQPFTDKSPR